jgi:hypothetical protein
MRRRGVKAVLGLFMLALALPAVAQEYAARLGRVPVDSRTQASVAGLGRAVAELDGNRLEIEGEFAGLLGPATVANLHMGPAVGVRGPVIHELKVTHQSDGELSGSMRLSAEQVAALRAGRLYIQVASESAPDGNLWGWLLSDE